MHIVEVGMAWSGNISTQTGIKKGSILFIYPDPLCT